MPIDASQGSLLFDAAIICLMQELKVETTLKELVNAPDEYPPYLISWSCGISSSFGKTNIDIRVIVYT